MSTIPTTRGNPQASDIAVQSALSTIATAGREDGQTVLDKINSTLNSPLRLYATAPTPDAVLNIAASPVTMGDTSGKTTAMVGGLYKTFAGATINFQTGATTGGTVTVDGAVFSLPSTTIGQHRRVAFVFTSDGYVNCTFSAAAATQGALASPETLFIKLTGTPLGYIDIVATASTAFKSSGAATDVIVNAVSGTHTIVNFGTGSAANGSGSGTGEINYILNPSAAVVINDGTPKTGFGGWVKVGSNLNLFKETNAGNFPRENLTASAIAVTGTSGTETTSDYVYYNFTLDDVDLNKVLKIQWDQKKIQNYVDGQLAVTITDQSNTLVATPVITNIPAQDGTFYTTFVSNSTAALRLKIAATGAIATNDGICISNVIVGPGLLVQGSAVSDLGSLGSPNFNFSGGGGSPGTVTVGKMYGWRLGNLLKLQVEYQITGSSDGTGSFQLTLPTGYVIDTTSMASFGRRVNILGRATYRVGTQTFKDIDIYPITNSILQFAYTSSYHSDDGTYGAGDGLWTNSGSFSFTVTMPIVGWSSGVMLTSNETKSPAKAGFIQAFAGDTAGFESFTSDSTTVYHKNGWALCNGASVSQSIYNQLYTNISTTWNTKAKQDGTGGNYSAPSSGYFRLPDLRGVFLRGVGTSSRADGSADITVSLGSFTDDTYISHNHSVDPPSTSTNTTGGHVHTTTTDAYYFSSSASSTVNPGPNGSLVYSVTTGNIYMSAAGDHSHTVDIGSFSSGSSGSTETASRYTGINYLIKLYDDSPASVAGFNVATVGNTGLVNNSAENTSGTPIKGVTDGSSASTGYVGEVISNTVDDTTNVAATTWTVKGQITLTPGVWKITAQGIFLQSGASGALTSGGILTVDTVGGTSEPSIRSKGVNESNMANFPASSGDKFTVGNITEYNVNITTSTTYYLKYYWGSVVNDTNHQWFRISATRIR